MLHPEIWHISPYELALRLVLAVILGGIIGIERELGGKSAGFRTHILVCLGSAGIVLLSIYGFAEFVAEPSVRMDPARLAAQVISGIGFLGAGTIFRAGGSISGLTTAASLWVVAAIGLQVGAGFYLGAVLTMVLVIVSLFLLNKVERWFARTRLKRDIHLQLKQSTGGLQDILAELHRSGIRVSGISVENEDVGVLKLCITIKLRTIRNFDMLLLQLSGITGVLKLETKDHYGM